MINWFNNKYFSVFLLFFVKVALRVYNPPYLFSTLRSIIWFKNMALLFITCVSCESKSTCKRAGGGGAEVCVGCRHPICDLLIQRDACYTSSLGIKLIYVMFLLNISPWCRSNDIQAHIIDPWTWSHLFFPLYSRCSLLSCLHWRATGVKLSITRPRHSRDCLWNMFVT